MLAGQSVYMFHRIAVVEAFTMGALYTCCCQFFTFEQQHLHNMKERGLPSVLAEW
jgi:hypothetical protein